MNVDFVTKELINTILHKDYSLDHWSFDNYVVVGQEIIQQKEIYPKLLGKLAYSLSQQAGKNMDYDFSEAVEAATGMKVSPSSIKHYRWVYSKVGHLPIPEDLSYSVWDHLASTEDPKMWLDKTIKEGWSGAELHRQIKIATGKDTRKTYICPACGHEFRK